MKIVGTPQNSSKDFKPIWMQEARNESGGKRFHGAFTGGFSAGYHNTVGSKEGWMPSTFHSSKDYGTASTITQGLEKYGDSEDFSVLRYLCGSVNL